MLRGCGEKGTLLHCWWQWYLIQPLRRTIFWWFLKKTKNRTPKSESLSPVRPFVTPMEYSLPGSSIRPWDFPGNRTGVGCHFLLQGTFLTQGSIPGLLHRRQTLLPLSHQGTTIWLSNSTPGHILWEKHNSKRHTHPNVRFSTICNS